MGQLLAQANPLGQAGPLPAGPNLGGPSSDGVEPYKAPERGFWDWLLGRVIMLDEQQTAKIQRQLGLDITISPEPRANEPFLTGSRISVDRAYRGYEPGMPGVSGQNWDLELPSGHHIRTAKYRPAGGGYTLQQGGTHHIHLTLFLTTGEKLTISKSFVAETPEMRAQKALGELPEADYDSFRGQMELQRTFAKPPGPEEAGKSPSRIVTTAPNPAPMSTTESPRYVTYRIEGRPEAKQFRWYVKPLDWNDLPDSFDGYSKVSTAQGPAYDLGTGTQVRWPTTVRNLYVILCQEYRSGGKEGAGEAIGEATYIQSVLPAQGIEQLERFEQYLERVDELAARLEPEQRVPVQAVYVDAESGDTLPLNLFIGRAKGDPSRVALVDMTPGLDPDQHTLEYGGATAAESLADFDRRNNYPDGHISLQIADNASGIPTLSRELETDGSSFLGSLAGGFGIASLLLGLGALAAAPFTGGGSLVVAALIVGSAATGVAAGGLSLADRLQKAELDETGVALDVLGVASSFVGGAAAVKLARGGAAVLVASTSTRYLLWTSFVAEGVAGLLISQQGVRQIAEILEDDRLDSDQKQQAIVRVLAGLVVTGGLLALSYGDINAVRNRLRSKLGTEVEGTLTDQDRLTLSLLDDVTLERLSGASTDDAQRLIAALRDDPTVLSRLAKGEGDLLAGLRLAQGDSADHLERALARQRFIDAGIDDMATSRLFQALTEARVPGLRLNALSRSDIEQLRLADDAIAAGDSTAAIRHMDQLGSVLEPAEQTAFETALTLWHGTTDLAAYRHPMAILPGGKKVGPDVAGHQGFFGTGDPKLTPDRVFADGLPARGPNLSIEDHVNQAKDSAFRGTTSEILTPDGQGAGAWADVGGWVYEIDGVPMWDANLALEGRRKIAVGLGGYGGNLMHGELEKTILAHVPAERIKRAIPILQGPGLRLKLGKSRINQNYRPRSRK
ncbi:MAG: hypothetical protein AAF560_25175 [Acidobacteriota bacterium]